jgi:hypothetical protein
MGRVLRGRHVATGAVRAIKVLDRTSDPELAARFRRESEALARVGPGVAVAIHEVGQEDSCVFYVMDLLEGGSLEDRIARGGKLPWADAASLVARLARRVARCHALGIVHRDLKPANVLFDGAGEPRLADFGCARDLTAATLTEAGTILGTPAYMAPEQLHGERGAAPSDVFALGAILRELITGERLRGKMSWGELARSVAAHRVDPIPRELGAPPELDELLARVLAADPAPRPSALALALELEQLPARARRRAGPWLPLAALLLLLALAALASVVTPRSGAKATRSGASGAETPETAPGTAEVIPVGSRDLEWLASHEEGRAELARLAAEAAVRPLDEVRAVSMRHPGDDSLAVLELVATLVSSSDLAAREAALERLRGRPLVGLPGHLFTAASLVQKVLTELPRRREAEARFETPDLLQPVLRLGVRPLLLGATVAPLATECRLYLELRYRRLSNASSVLGDVLRALPFDESSLDALPAAVEIAWLRAHTNPEPEPRAVQIRRAERIARRLEATDPELAADAFAIGFERRLLLTPEMLDDLDDGDRLLEQLTVNGAEFAPVAQYDLIGAALRKVAELAARTTMEKAAEQLLQHRRTSTSRDARRLLTRSVAALDLLLDASLADPDHPPSLERARASEWNAPSRAVPDGEKGMLPGMADDPFDLLLDDAPDVAALERVTRRAIAVSAGDRDRGATIHAIRARVLRLRGDEEGVRAERKAIGDALALLVDAASEEQLPVAAVRLAAFLRLPLGRRGEPDANLGAVSGSGFEHATGHEASDAWSVGPDDKPGVLVARRVPGRAGQHVARFALAADAHAAGSEELARLEVAGAAGQVLAARPIRRSDFLPPLEEPTDFAVPFESGADQSLELRILWNGNGFIKVTRVALGR